MIFILGSLLDFSDKERFFPQPDKNLQWKEKDTGASDFSTVREQHLQDTQAK